MSDDISKKQEEDTYMQLNNLFVFSDRNIGEDEKRDLYDFLNK